MKTGLIWMPSGKIMCEFYTDEEFKFIHKVVKLYRFKIVEMVQSPDLSTGEAPARSKDAGKAE